MDITNLRQTHHPSILITIISGTVFGPMCHGIVLSIFNPTAREDGNMPTSLISYKLPVPSCESVHGLACCLPPTSAVQRFNTAGWPFRKRHRTLQEEPLEDRQGNMLSCLKFPIPPC
ncbi:hypothetical protein E4U59_002492 [Claviceps monticola]|nr:hypothetical protein E4U59_002492 [Claviceps monticola]